jgi:hypothetical protein
MTGKLLQGEDNAKHGVAIWPDFDPDSKTVDIFFGGLSGETAELVLPKPIEKRLRTPSGEEKVITKTKLMLFKTRHLRFKLVGDVDSRPLNTPVLLSRDWVMR